VIPGTLQSPMGSGAFPRSALPSFSARRLENDGQVSFVAGEDETFRENLICRPGVLHAARTWGPASCKPHAGQEVLAMKPANYKAAKAHARGGTLPARGTLT